MNYWARSAAFYKGMPKRSTFAFLAGVFCLIASLGFILDTTNTQATTPLSIMANVLVRGGFGMVWAFAGTRRMIKVLIVLAPAQFAAMYWVIHASRNLPQLAASSPALQTKLQIDANGAITLIITGYVLFLIFFRWEGQRYFAAHADMQLAADIHRSLVPDVCLRTDEFEIYGSSVPSGQVGGDLVDVVNTGSGWFAYVADVSGHGVSAGVLMSMIKTAVRTKLDCDNSGSKVLGDLNRVLKPLTAPNMFITIAYLDWMGGSKLTFGLAGHPPILHFRRSTGAVEELSVSNTPLCIVTNGRFIVGSVSVEPADVLALVTDGLTEVFDGKDRELGMEPLKEILRDRFDAPLNETAKEIRSRAQAHGKQTDDQTVLLLRRLT